MMILKADLYRIIKGKLGLIALAGLLGLIIFGYFVFSFRLGDRGAPLMILRIVSAFVPIFLTNIYMIVWGDEFSQRVINNVLITKVSRTKIFIVKFILAYLLTIVLTLLVLLVDIIIGYILGNQVDVANLLLRTAIQGLGYFVLTGLAALLFTYLSKPYVAVAAFISYTIVIESLASNLISGYLPQFEPFTHTLPTYILSEAINAEVLTSQFMWTSLIAAVGYGLILFVISCLIFNKKEFK